MKTHETKAASQPRRLDAGEEPRKKGAFAKVLEQKTAQEKPPEPGGDSGPRLSLRSGMPEAPAAVSSPVTVRDLDGLAHEISVSLRGADLREVQIRMDSKTLGGLEIRISKESGKLNVRLQAASTEIARSLGQQTDALAQRLEMRGYPGAIVQVQGPAASAFREKPVRDRREQGSGDQGQSEQRQDRRNK